MIDQRGARWLAREQREIGAASSGDDRPSTGQHHPRAGEPPRYPLVERLSERSLAALAEVMGELGMVEAGVVGR